MSYVLVKEKNLTILADKLFEEIGKFDDAEDWFTTKTVICPNILTEQWLKAYWLKTKGEKVLMNVVFKTLNNALPDFIDNNEFKLLNKNALRQIIISILCDDDSKNTIVCPDYSYYEGNSIKLYDYASQLASVLLDYYKDNFEDIPNWKPGNFQYDLLQKVNEIGKINGFGSIEKPIPFSGNKKSIYMFGFSKIDKVYRNLINSCSFVKEYALEIDSSSNTPYEVTKAPSKVREMEYLHSIMCELLHKGAVASDFLIVAPNVGEYENVIERVFRQGDGFPSIPYVISHHKKAESYEGEALRLLFGFYKNGFYTRFDFDKLITNPTIQLKRSISDEDIASWRESIIELNVFRNHDFQNDWDYLKKRLILSKMSSINFEDNIVALTEGDYLPYSSINLDDESINKIIDIIDDISSFVCSISRISKGQLSPSENPLDIIRNELSKWFSLEKDGIETNRQYKKILNVLDSFRKIWNKGISVDNVFYSLFDECAINSVQRGQAFTQGVSFVDFDINAVFASKYVFFIGASSSNIPLPTIKNELDARIGAKENYDRLTFSLLYQNAKQKMFISFVSEDLKTDEEFFLTPIVDELNKKKNRYDGEKEKIHVVPLDEIRPYSELYTLKEFNDRKYVNNLIDPTWNSTSKKVVPQNNKSTYLPIFYESVTVSNLADYLEEPLAFKTNKLFGSVDDTYKKMRDEWEPFVLNPLDNSVLVKKIMFEKIKDEKSYDDKMMFEVFKLNNLLISINNEYQISAFTKAEKSAVENASIVKNVSNNNYFLVERPSIKLMSEQKIIETDDKGNEKIVSKDKEWELSSSNSHCLYVDGYNRYYFELKNMKKKEIHYFLHLYILALMDVAGYFNDQIAKEDEEEYNIHLVRGEDPTQPQDSGKFAERDQWIFKIKPSKAVELLNSIHAAMGDYSNNALAPIEAVNTKCDTYQKLKDALQDNFWKYFNYTNLFDHDVDLGYDPHKYKLEHLVKEVNKQLSQIDFVDKLEMGDYKND